MYDKSAQRALLGKTTNFLSFVKAHTKLSLGEAKKLIDSLREVINYHDWRYYV